MYPEDLKYTAEHEWLKAGEEGPVRVGITDFAQDQLGDIVFVQLPDVGSVVRAGDACGELESTKSVSDLFAPVNGTVTAVNEALADQPDLVNSDPYGEGWLLDIDVEDTAEVAALMDAEAYQAQLDQA
ncbi:MULTISPECIES: glycine cleavage system protein GcvH [Kribbella]|uniref:Glycine cleavage system H protein n=1 Tax=Kribbella pratensis TaxID=2512112 RepID=A0ABY2FKU9_9ACTN|nr:MULTISPECIES: glycine cleavage system protein GcvH [Kribbella]TDW86171.1 glycine cleavage system H protein [Kribbella sp. VKM Ac-2566]TDW93769.1 glycine cleavage system H protein [Kribbella pratensis]